MLEAKRPVRGSRKHVLEWTSRPEFCVELLQTVSPVAARISADSRWMPCGYDAPQEARLETFGPRILPNRGIWDGLRKWWLAHEEGANTPNWDIAVGCEIDGAPGIVLVEAKANVPELSAGGKSLPAAASLASRKNHERIRSAVAEAGAGLRRYSDSLALSCDSHYQLCNRIAFAWKLASLGVPTVLIYLGFVGDTGIVDAGEPFENAGHWQRVFQDYANAVGAEGLLERRLDCGASDAWVLARSRPVLAPSPPRESLGMSGLPQGRSQE